MAKIIKYNGENLVYKAGYRVQLEFERLFGKTTDEIKTFEDAMRLVWLGTKEAARKQNVEFNLNLEEFMDWLDDNPDALIGFSGDKMPTEDSQEKKS